MKSRIAAATLSLALGLAATAHATLIDRGGGLIYDSDLDVTWLADANYAETSGFDADGAMTWADAMTWVGNLSYGGFTDWRLPLTPQSDPACSIHFGDGNGALGTGVGNNCTGGEMGHLYTELGGVSPASITAVHDADYDLFQNIQSNNNYWSGSEHALNTAAAFAYLFASGSGGDSQTVSFKSNSFHAWAVRDGDVLPEPAAGWLFGLFVLGFVRGNRTFKLRSRPDARV
jgi:hypothetical protein